MSNWEREFKKYFIHRLKAAGIEISPDMIKKIAVNTDLDPTLFEIPDLALIYAFAITREDFKQAKEISDEFANRNAEVKFETNDKTKTGVINVYIKPDMNTAVVDIKMKIVDGDLMIDFEGENFG